MTDDLKDKLLNAALENVVFDGWGVATFDAAVQAVGIDTELAKAVFPRGAVDMAAAYHKRGDAEMLDRMAVADLGAMRYSERVAAGVRFRLEAIENKEVVRRGMTLFAMPQHAGEGAQLVWGTADAIWNKLGDTSDDINWYSKRAILSGVYGSTLLFWLGDTSDGYAATWAFLERRIGNVMQIEKLKSQVRGNPVLSKLFTIPNALLKNVKAPSKDRRSDLPGHWTPRGGENS
ncbi:MAG: COQ9 family protein [Paracoccaceae bacterium]